MTPFERSLRWIPDTLWSGLIWVLAVGLCGWIAVWEYFRIAERVWGNA